MLFTLVLGGWAMLAWGGPTGDLLTGFKPVGEYVLEFEGRELEDAAIYRSAREVCILLISPELPSPLLLNLRRDQVLAVAESAVDKTVAEAVRVTEPVAAEIATLERHRDGAYRETFQFAIDGRRAVLRPRAPLLGHQGAAAVGRRHPMLPLVAAKARSRDADLEHLRALQDEVRVRIYFGSWCRNCDRILGKVLRLEEDLAGSNITFEYYGLPKPFDGEAVAIAEDVHGVPLADVYLGNEKRGRIGPLDLDDPAAALLAVLVGTVPSPSP